MEIVAGILIGMGMGIGIMLLGGIMNNLDNQADGYKSENVPPYEDPLQRRLAEITEAQRRKTETCPACGVTHDLAE